MQQNNILKEIQSIIGQVPCFYSKNRKEQVVVIRCHIGHARMTHILSNLYIRTPKET